MRRHLTQGLNSHQISILLTKLDTRADLDRLGLETLHQKLDQWSIEIYKFAGLR